MIVGKDLKKNDIEQFKDLLRWGADSNKDAYGYFSPRKLFKKKGAYNGEPLKLSDNPWFIVGHNRYTTTGDAKDNKNNHPFESNRFIMVHNGIINNHLLLRRGKIEGETDSIVIIENLEKSIRSNKVVDAIKKTAEQLTGSFSVMLYDKQDDKLYYFKNKMTRFSFARYQFKDKVVVFGSTNENSLNSLYVNWDGIFPVGSYQRRVVVQPEDDTIYEITVDTIKAVKTFKPATTALTTTTKSDYNYWYGDGPSKAIDVSYSLPEKDRLRDELKGFFKDYLNIDLTAWTYKDMVGFSWRALTKENKELVMEEIGELLIKTESNDNIGYLSLDSVEEYLRNFGYNLAVTL
jgi:asparagine synthetase B (glutamine-hydrolysing)